MKALLTAINAKYIHTNPAVYSLMKHASQYGDFMELAEYTINNQMDAVVRDLYERKPDVLFFSCYVWNIEYVKDVAGQLKKVLPRTDIWFGGPEVSYDGPVILQDNSYLKGVMIGEGETVFTKLMRFYSYGDICLKDIEGLMYRENERIVMTKPGSLVPMDELKFLYEEPERFAHRIIYYESSRGCPFRCSYCMSSIDKTVRFRSMELVKKELGFFLAHNVLQVKFIDRTFNIRVDRTMEILQFLLEHDNGITNFHFEVAADIITDEEIALMNQMRPGLIQLEIGVQSTNPDTIREIDRTMDLERVKEVVRTLRKPGNIHIHLDLIAGLPKEDIKSFIHSFNEVYELRPQELQLGFLKVLKGAKMHDKAEEYGLIYADKAPYEVLKTNWMDFDDIIRLKAVEEMTEVYYNSGLFSYTFEFLEQYFDSAFDMYDCLAAYYKEHGLFDMKHTRITRYSILLDFIRSLGRLDMEVFEQLLVFDLYLRENLKTRPDFACDGEIYKELTRDSYRKLSKTMKSKIFHVEPFHLDILKLMKDKEICRRDCLIVFDYENRHPVSKMAAVEEYVWQ
ncbi:MAG: DUF4080 domain-containing protein [Thermoflexaceae bacterium]|nr:DUF4080 domain-containing protein [Thermoflexaceae bacterium]